MCLLFYMDLLQKYVQQQLEWSSNVKDAYLELQHGYRIRERIGYKNLEQIQAYVFTRFPATYRVCLKLVDQYLKGLTIRSVLDWGCGVGTASLALSEYFQDLECFLVEQDQQAKTYATQFIKHFYPKNIINEDMPSKNIDLCIFSYSLGETSNWQKILDDTWKKTSYLLIIEPGTSAHYRQLLAIRDYMIKKNAYLLGPCCHTKICPLQSTDWCHFSVNVPRSKEHRRLKNGKRGFEEEAYTYMLFSKIPKESHDFGRLVARPKAHGGHIDLKICSKDGAITVPTIGRSSKYYKALKKCNWGDAIKNELL